MPGVAISELTEASTTGERYQAIRQTTYLIVPFVLHTNYRSAVEQLLAADYAKRDGARGKLWGEKAFGKQRFFAHIDSLIGEYTAGKNESIGTRLLLDDAARSSLHLPNNQSLTFEPDKQSFSLSLGKIELYLFETQVGFFVFDIGYPEGSSIDEIVLCNYYLKKLYQYRDGLHYRRRISKDEQVVTPVSLCGLIKHFLSGLQVETYFEEANGYPCYANVYSSVLLGSEYAEVHGSDAERLLQYLFYMRRSFKDTYAAAPSEFNVEGNSELAQLFENSYWGVSLEGAAHIAYLRGDKSDPFFLDTHAEHVRETYFYLYMIALHQHYALQSFSILASKLPSLLEDYVAEKKDTVRMVEELKSKIVFFKLRCAFKQVSHISHQTALYEMFRGALRIEDLMDELQLELDALSSITDMERTRRSKKLENIFLIVTTIFVIISTLNDSMGIISFVDKSEWPANKESTPIIAGALWTAMAAAIGYFIYKWLRTRRK